jgi:endonuclease/exonuclease/phosphatase family metal-dependent hydrolase
VPFDVARVVRGFDADIVVVPETYRDEDGRCILDPLRDEYHVETLELMRLALRTDLSARRDLVPRVGAWELAVCSRFPVRDVHVITLGHIGSDPATPRQCLALTIDVDGTDVEMIGLHTSSHLHVFAPIRHLLGLKRQLPVRGPQIIAGDYNWWGPPVHALMPGWQRPVRGRTWPAHRPHSQIDHVLVRGGIECISGEVLGQTPSDHRPVRARLRL